MKKCPFCAEEIQDEAIKCRFCGERIGKRGCRRIATRWVGLTFAFVTFVVSLSYTIITFYVEHEEHGHERSLDDPEHILGVAVVVITAVWMWRTLTKRRRR